MAPKFSLQIMSLKGIAFEDMVESVHIDGDDGEFEILAFHYPLLSSVPEGEIRIAGHNPIPVKVGILAFRNNQCRIIAQVDENFKGYKQLWDI